jgi:hypothetical protein|nr:MAG TPA: hypothetical protein [Bacteriophage sp.]
MKHGLSKLLDRLEYKRSLNISFDSGQLIDEVREAIGLYGDSTFCVVWCDPKDDFVKDYFVIDNSEYLDEDEQEALIADKSSFTKNRHADDMYIVTLSELMGVLEYQDRIS